MASRLEAGTIVNAAGPNAGKVAAMAGLALPVEPRKRSVFVFEAREKFDDMPLLVDPSGIYVRPRRLGLHHRRRRARRRPTARPTRAISSRTGRCSRRSIWPVLATRIPAFEAIKATRAWAGHYDYNTLDQNGVIGPHPEVANFLFANGFSGHGLQQAPAVGKAIAELIVHGGYRTIDCSAFGYDASPKAAVPRAERDLRRGSEVEISPSSDFSSCRAGVLLPGLLPIAVVVARLRASSGRSVR